MRAIKTAVIIGGGIAGPALALALRKAGIEATVHEAYAKSAEGVGGTLMLAPNGLEALRTIGVDASALGEPIQRMIMADGTGRTLGEFAGVPGLPASRVLWRPQLYDALRERLASEGLEIQYGQRLVGVDETDAGITARFADGSVAHGDVLIGADGIRSKVRTLIDPDAPGPEYLGFLGFGGFAPRGATHVPEAMHFVNGRAFLGYWTAPDGGAWWFASLPHEQPLTMAEANEVEASEWLRRLRELYADDVPARDLVANTTPDQFLIAGASEILPHVPTWYRGRMVLVGDSALSPSSSSGQGASLALESAIELARCLRDLPDVPTAFAAYERLRRPRVEKVAAEGARQAKRKAAGPIARAMMRVLMPVVMKLFFSPEKIFGWVHRHRIAWDEVVAG